MFIRPSGPRHQTVAGGGVVLGKTPPADDEVGARGQAGAAPCDPLLPSSSLGFRGARKRQWRALDHHQPIRSETIRPELRQAQRGALRPQAVTRRISRPPPHRPVEMLCVFSTPHGQILSASAARRAALAGDADAAGFAGIACAIGARWPFAARTRAKISSLEPNAIALPS